MSEPGRIDPSAWDGADQTDPCGPPRPTLKANTDHCVFDGVRGAFVCEHCRGEFKVRLPVDVAVFSERCGAFIALHGGCEK